MPAQTVGMSGVPCRTAYAATKHAQFGFFDSLRIELDGTGVDVVMIAPDFVVTQIHKRALAGSGRPLGESPLQESKVMSAQECAALRSVFGTNRSTHINNTKSFIGHCMGAAGALEMAGNLAAFDDGVCHATINVDQLDPECKLEGLVLNEAREIGSATYILSNSFGMLGINSAVVVKKI